MATSPQFMVSSNLEPEDIMASADSLPLPASVVSYFQGAIGVPPGGFPEPLTSKVRKGRSLPDGSAAYEGRPGATMPDYDFAEAKKFLSDLPAELEKANPGGVAELEAQLSWLEPPPTAAEVGAALLATLPNIISVPFAPEGTDNQVDAAVRAIVDKVARLKRMHKLSMKNLTYSATAPSAARPTDAQSSRPTDAESSGSRSRTVSLQPSFTVSRVSQDL